MFQQDISFFRNGEVGEEELFVHFGKFGVVVGCLATKVLKEEMNSLMAGKLMKRLWYRLVKDFTKVLRCD